MGNHTATEKLARNFIKKFPRHGYGWRTLAFSLYEMGVHEASRSAADTALELNPQDQYAHNIMGWLLLETGHLDIAEIHFQRAIELDPGFFYPYFGLAKTRKFTANDSLLSFLLKNKQHFANDSRLEINYLASLAKAYKAIGDLAKFLEYTSLTNKRQREITCHSITDDLNLFHNVQLKDRISPDISIKAPKAPAIPIFILGMPRSGTTLVEQILSNHPSVAQGGELTYLSESYSQFCGLNDYAAKACESTRRHYFKRTQTTHNGYPYFTDKNPQNFLFIGLIKRALPEAKIIHVVRNPRDVCWSNFRTIFKTGNLPYSNDLNDVVTYYNHYADLMAYWYKRYPESVYTLKYESLVNNIEHESKSLLSHLGLPWDSACLAFQENPNPVKTASQLQVRQHLKNMNDEWKSFETFLEKPFEQLKTPEFWEST
ncbi:tetratricopeptide repeat-containing sulfotransferase family protein [Fluviibacter phosphoraccumulans]